MTPDPSGVGEPELVLNRVHPSAGSAGVPFSAFGQGFANTVAGNTVLFKQSVEAEIIEVIPGQDGREDEIRAIVPARSPPWDRSRIR